MRIGYLLWLAGLAACKATSGGGESGPDETGGKPQSAAYDRPGYAVYEEKGRLWVFRDGSKKLGEYLGSGEPAKRVTRIGAGPDGRTVMGPDAETIDSYLGGIGRS